MTATKVWIFYRGHMIVCINNGLSSRIAFGTAYPNTNWFLFMRKGISSHWSINFPLYSKWFKTAFNGKKWMSTECECESEWKQRHEANWSSSLRISDSNFYSIFQWLDQQYSSRSMRCYLVRMRWLSICHYLCATVKIVWVCSIVRAIFSSHS